MTLRSRDDDDIMHISQMQLSVADEHLPPTYASEVLNILVTELELIGKEINENLNSDWSNMNMETLCAITNDAIVLSDEVEALINRDEKKILVEIDKVCTQFTQLAANVNFYIAKTIVKDVEDEYLRKVGDSDWRSSDAIVQILVGTMTDYFEDLSVWLTEHFFSKCIVQSKDIILDIYIKLLLNNGGLGIECREETSNTIDRDRAVLLNFFHDLQIIYREWVHFDRNISKKEVLLESLDSFSTLLSAESSKEMKKDISIILSKLDEQSKKIFLSLIKMFSSSNDEQESSSSAGVGSPSKIQKEMHDFINYTKNHQMFSMSFLSTKSGSISTKSSDADQLSQSSKTTGNSSNKSTSSIDRVIGLSIGLKNQGITKRRSSC